ncbi:hypothetical protein [Natronorarus salvus]|uniref:hypothetical protein n=1 Tax=Natronorarus salvus TaxID=3117733 RepID=UPI002F264090
MELKSQSRNGPSTSAVAIINLSLQENLSLREGQKNAVNTSQEEGRVSTGAESIEAASPEGDCEVLESLSERVESLEQQIGRFEKLETELERKEKRITELESRLDETSPNVALPDFRTSTTESIAKLETALAELQAREIEKGAYLPENSLYPDSLPENADIERFLKNGEYYYRLLNTDDPLERDEKPQLAYADLLPIQKLATWDTEDLEGENIDVRIAVWLWSQRNESGSLWKRGSKGVRQYVEAGDLKTAIRARESVSDEYGKKLVSRTFDAILRLSNNRLVIRKKEKKQNGLSYQERRLILPEDSSIPGETTNSTGDSEQ